MILSTHPMALGGGNLNFNVHKSALKWVELGADAPKSNSAPKSKKC